MTRRMMATAALAGLTALQAVPASAQTPTPTYARAPAHGALPIARMIEIYEQLDLSAQQIERIRAIDARLETQNRPLREQLAQAREKLMAERRDMKPADRQRLSRERAARVDSMRTRMQDMTPAERDSMRSRMQGGRPGMARPPLMRGGDTHGPVPARPLRSAMPDELRPAVAQIRANAEAAEEQIRSVLTDAQRQKLQNLRAHPRSEDRPPAGQRDRRDGLRQAPRGAR